jgi:hypothetical protein
MVINIRSHHHGFPCAIHNFQHEEHHYIFKGITVISPDIIISHRMENILRKGHLGIVAQFLAIKSFETPSQPIHPNMYLVLAEHQSVFEPP